MGALIPYTPAEREMITRLALEGKMSAEITRLLNAAGIGPRRRQETIRASTVFKAARQARRAPLDDVSEEAVAPPFRPKSGAYRCPHFPNERISLPVVKGYTPESAHV